MPTHIKRLLLVLVAAGTAAYAAKVLFTADSFYAYGHYRGKSVEEIAADKPKFKGSQSCASCHAQRFAAWSAGAHRSPERGKAVQCEVCHGAAGGRDPGAAFEHVATGLDHPSSGRLAVPADSLRLCALCHEKMPGRPQAQPQVAIAEHAGTEQCTACHDPHSPKTLRGAAVALAAPAKGAAAIAAGCAGCHGAEGVSANPAWPSIAGQHSAYLLDALKAYKAGAREHPMMAAAARALSEADMRALAARYAALPRRAAGPAAPSGADDPQGLAVCAGCHGAEGVSANPAWPNLAGQQKQYMVAAMQAYKAGRRRHAPMAAAVGALGEAQMEALAAYYASRR